MGVVLYLDGGVDRRHLVLLGDDVWVVGVGNVHHVNHRVVVNKVVQRLKKKQHMQQISHGKNEDATDRQQQHQKRSTADASALQRGAVSIYQQRRVWMLSDDWNKDCTLPDVEWNNNKNTIPFVHERSAI